MQNTTIQQKAMQDIFALDEAVSQFESFGSQLDLGLPSEEDDAPKSFDDMLEVNPSNEPMEFGENFMSEGDDMADKQTQKFVVDEFAKEAAKLPDGDISAADITGISAIIQMNNHLTGDVRSFIKQTIDRAVQAQQQQNVSDAQPNGTVAQDIAKTGDEAPIGDDNVLDPTGDAGIPAMDPIDPTAEPSLDANIDAGIDTGIDTGADPMGGVDTNIGGDDLGAGIDEMNATLDAENGAEPDAAVADLGADIATGDETADVGAEPDAAGSDLDKFLDSDESASSETAGNSEDTSAESDTKDTDTETSDDKDKKDDKDEDFNFEAIATKARGLVEGAEETAAMEEGATAGEAQATEDLSSGEQSAESTSESGSESEPTATVECGGQPSANDDAEFAEKAAQVESIVMKSRMKMAAENAKSILEAYHGERNRANTLAKLDNIVSNLKQNAMIESIVKQYGEQSKKNAMLESQIDNVLAEVKEDSKRTSMVESMMGRIDEFLSKNDVSEKKSAADKVVAEFEATMKTNETPAVVESEDKQLEERLNSILESVKRETEAQNTLTTKLNSILESIQPVHTPSAEETLDSKLNALVDKVKNA